MKVAIFIDRLTNKAGIPRIILELAKHFNADIYAGEYDPKNTFKELETCKIHVLLKSNLPQRLKTLILMYKFKKLKLDYDFYIFFGGGSLEVAGNHKPNLWFCSAPKRYLYDLYYEELNKFRNIKKCLFFLITTLLRKRDQKNVTNVEEIITISKNVHQRVKKFYQRESILIYPFVDLMEFKWITQENFYLSTARVDPIKRVDLVVKAFQKMPNKNLIIASSGPDYFKIKNLAKGYKNIKVLGWVSESKLRELYGSCIATFSVSHKEDFGLIPIESMACGKPCIATNSGGHLETIIHNKTGLLIDPKNINNIVNAVKELNSNRAKEMREDCQERVKQFSKIKFMKQMEEHIEKQINKK